MDLNNSQPTQNLKRRVADIPSLIIFIILMIMYIGVASYAVQNGQLANSFTYIHNKINQAADIDSNIRVVVQILDDINQARFLIITFVFLAAIFAILTIVIIQKATTLVLYCGILCEFGLLTGFFILTIISSQSQMYKHSSSRPYLFFPLTVGCLFLKLWALKHVGMRFLSNIIIEACRYCTYLAIAVMIYLWLPGRTT